MKILVFVIVLFLCCFSLDVFGSDASQSASNHSNNPENPNPPPISSPVELLEGLVQYFNAAEVKNQEQGKMNQDLKEEIKLLQEKNAQELKTLSDKFEEFQNKISEDHGLWLLTPPLRGPPGKNGEPGEKGDRGQEGPPGKDGKQGERGLSALESISSCSAAMESLLSPRSKKQTIYPHGNTNKKEVLCDFETDGGGWTIIQKRTSGPQQDFDRSWTEYAHGFGPLDGNFWLGLDNIHALTKNGDQELRIELEDFQGNRKYAKYSSFSISDASDFYKLTIGGFVASSTAGDSMTHNDYTANGARFSTKDRDNQGNTCVERYSTGGWWINGCFFASLNGLYRGNGETVPHAKGIMWASWTSYSKSLAKTEIKIRQRK